MEGRPARGSVVEQVLGTLAWFTPSTTRTRWGDGQQPPARHWGAVGDPVRLSLELRPLSPASTSCSPGHLHGVGLRPPLHRRDSRGEL